MMLRQYIIQSSSIHRWCKRYTNYDARWRVNFQFSAFVLYGIHCWFLFGASHPLKSIRPHKLRLLSPRLLSPRRAYSSCIIALYVDQPIGCFRCHRYTHTHTRPAQKPSRAYSHRTNWTANRRVNWKKSPRITENHAISGHRLHSNQSESRDIFLLNTTKKRVVRLCAIDFNEQSDLAARCVIYSKPTTPTSCKLPSPKLTQQFIRRVRFRLANRKKGRR